MTNIEDDEDLDTGAPSSQAAATALPGAFVAARSSRKAEASSTVEAPTSTAPSNPPNTNRRSYDFLRTETAASLSLASLPLPSANSRPSYRSALTVMPLPETSNWQEILMAHSRLNSAGQPVDDAGKAINLKDMNPKFGGMLAQTCIDLDSSGHKGQYYILSGRRTHEEQASLYNYYHSRGSKHPVAEPGHSPHEWGLATDLQYTGKNADKFYADFHAHGEKNGMGFVNNDINHCQIGGAPNVMAQMRQKQPAIMMASNHKVPAVGPAFKLGVPA